MLGMVTENTLYFRVDDQNRETFREAEAFPPLNYAKQGETIDLAFWRVPERLYDEPDEFITWARAALAAAHRVAAKRPAAKRRQVSASERPEPAGGPEERRYPAAASTLIGEVSAPLSSSFGGSPANAR